MNDEPVDTHSSLTSTGGSILLSQNNDKNDANDTTPTSSTDAASTCSASLNVTDDPISSTSSDVVDKCKSTAESKQIIYNKDMEASKSLLGADSDVDLLDMSIVNTSSEPINEDVEDIVQDLENLLGESEPINDFSSHRKKVDAKVLNSIHMDKDNLVSLHVSEEQSQQNTDQEDILQSLTDATIKSTLSLGEGGTETKEEAGSSHQESVDEDTHKPLNELNHPSKNEEEVCIMKQSSLEQEDVKVSAEESELIQDNSKTELAEEITSRDDILNGSTIVSDGDRTSTNISENENRKQSDITLNQTENLDKERTEGEEYVEKEIGSIEDQTSITEKLVEPSNTDTMHSDVEEREKEEISIEGLSNLNANNSSIEVGICEESLDKYAKEPDVDKHVLRIDKNQPDKISVESEKDYAKRALDDSIQETPSLSSKDDSASRKSSCLISEETSAKLEEITGGKEIKIDLTTAEDQPKMEEIENCMQNSDKAEMEANEKLACVLKSTVSVEKLRDAVSLSSKEKKAILSKKCEENIESNPEISVEIISNIEDVDKTNLLEATILGKTECQQEQITVFSVEKLQSSDELVDDTEKNEKKTLESENIGQSKGDQPQSGERAEKSSPLNLEKQIDKLEIEEFDISKSEKISKSLEQDMPKIEPINVITMKISESEKIDASLETEQVEKLHAIDENSSLVGSLNEKSIKSLTVAQEITSEELVPVIEEKIVSKRYNYDHPCTHHEVVDVHKSHTVVSGTKSKEEIEKDVENQIIPKENAGNNETQCSESQGPIIPMTLSSEKSIIEDEKVQKILNYPVRPNRAEVAFEKTEEIEVPTPVTLQKEIEISSRKMDTRLDKDQIKEHIVGTEFASLENTELDKENILHKEATDVTASTTAPPKNHTEKEPIVSEDSTVVLNACTEKEISLICPNEQNTEVLKCSTVECFPAPKTEEEDGKSSHVENPSELSSELPKKEELTEIQSSSTIKQTDKKAKHSSLGDSSKPPDLESPSSSINTEDEDATDLKISVKPTEIIEEGKPIDLEGSQFINEQYKKKDLANLENTCIMSIESTHEESSAESMRTKALTSKEEKTVNLDLPSTPQSETIGEEMQTSMKISDEFTTNEQTKEEESAILDRSVATLKDKETTVAESACIISKEDNDEKKLTDLESNTRTTKHTEKDQGDLSATAEEFTEEEQTDVESSSILMEGHIEKEENLHPLEGLPVSPNEPTDSIPCTSSSREVEEQGTNLENSSMNLKQNIEENEPTELKSSSVDENIVKEHTQSVPTSSEEEPIDEKSSTIPVNINIVEEKLSDMKSISGPISTHSKEDKQIDSEGSFERTQELPSEPESTDLEISHAPTIDETNEKELPVISFGEKEKQKIGATDEKVKQTIEYIVEEEKTIIEGSVQDEKLTIGDTDEKVKQTIEDIVNEEKTIIEETVQEEKLTIDTDEKVKQTIEDSDEIVKETIKDTGEEENLTIADTDETEKEDILKSALNEELAVVESSTDEQLEESSVNVESSSKADVEEVELVAVGRSTSKLPEKEATMFLSSTSSAGDFIKEEPVLKSDDSVSTMENAIQDQTTAAVQSILDNMLAEERNVETNLSKEDTPLVHSSYSSYELQKAVQQIQDISEMHGGEAIDIQLEEEISYIEDIPTTVSEEKTEDLELKTEEENLELISEEQSKPDMAPVQTSEFPSVSEQVVSSPSENISSSVLLATEVSNVTSKRAKSDMMIPFENDEEIVSESVIVCEEETIKKPLEKHEILQTKPPVPMVQPSIDLSEESSSDESDEDKKNNQVTSTAIIEDPIEFVEDKNTKTAAPKPCSKSDKPNENISKKLLSRETRHSSRISEKIKERPQVDEPLSINIEEAERERIYSPKITVKSIKDDESVDEKEEHKGSLKITITKQSDNTHSILKICSPDTEQRHKQIENDDQNIVPKLVIKTNESDQNSPKISTRSSKQITCTNVNQRSGSPRITIKPILKPDAKEVTSPLKITIKPLGKPEEFSKQQQQRHSPKSVKSKTDDDHYGTRSKVLKVVENSEVHSPKVTIKPILKPTEEIEQPTTPKIIIKPVEKPDVETKTNPKITIKPVIKPPAELESEVEDEAKKRIVLKINKNTIPSKESDKTARESRKREFEEDKSEKLAKIKLKFSKGGDAHIIHETDLDRHSQSTKRTHEFEHEKVKRLKSDTSNPGSQDSDDDDDVKLIEDRQSPIVISEDSQSQDSVILIEEVKERVPELPKSNEPLLTTTLLSVKHVPPPSAPRKRGRPRKVPLVVREDKEAVMVEPSPVEPSPVEPTTIELTSSTRPKRSCRGQSVRDTLGIKPRKPKGPSKPRGGKRGSPLKSMSSRPEKELTFSDGKLELIKKAISEVVVQDPRVVSTLTEEALNTREIPAKTLIKPLELKGLLEAAKDQNIIEVIEIDTPSNSPKSICAATDDKNQTENVIEVVEITQEDSGGTAIDKEETSGGVTREEDFPKAEDLVKDERDCGKDLSELITIDAAASDVEMQPPTPVLAPPINDSSSIEIAHSTDISMFEEETRMSAETSSRAQTPAKQVVSTDVVEESQSSMQSTATTESGKISRRSRMEVHQDMDVTVCTADQLNEYYWGGNGPFMIQEQVAQFLGIKSFKRKYPVIPRRMVDMQERDYIRENGLASESMCDLGLTAVNSADILDIMYTDFQEKYEEYCKYQRDKQAKDLLNKQKALSLTANQEKSKLDIAAQAIHSAAAYNANFNKVRKEQRKACMDLQSMNIHYPKNRIKQVSVPKIGHYPVVVVPGQFSDYYKDFTPTELNNFPLNTMLYTELHKILPEVSDSDSDSSGSDSDDSSSSGSDSDSSCGDRCKICNSSSDRKSTTTRKSPVHANM